MKKTLIVVGVTPESHKAALTTMKMCHVEICGQ